MLHVEAMREERETVLIGLDVGTSSLKAVAYDVAGHPLYSVHEPLEVISYPGYEDWFEQDAREIYSASMRALQNIINHVKSERYLLGLSSTSPGLLLLDADGEPIRHAILWMDRRAVAEAKLISDKLGTNHVYERTGLHVDAIFTAAKLLWVKSNAPQIFQKTRYIVQLKDFLFYKLTGETLTDYSHISETLFYTLDGKFFDELLELVEIDEEKFFKPEKSTAVYPMKEDTARDLGIKEAFIALGGVDSACATLGSGGIAPDVVIDTTGTSTCLDITAEYPVIDPQGRFETYWHVIPGKYILEACTPTSGGAIRKALQLIGDEEGNPDKYITSLEPSGLIVLPFLSGSRSPDWIPQLRGVIHGVSLLTDRRDIIKGFMEGIAYWERYILDEFGKLGFSFKEVRLVGGGGTRNWAAIKANVTGRKFAIMVEKEASALGAALLAGIGGGVYKDLDDILNVIHVESYINPSRELVRRYDELYEAYMALWLAIKNINTK